MSQQQQEQEEHEAVICDALARVGAGLAGMREARILATALGPRFFGEHTRRKDFQPVKEISRG